MVGVLSGYIAANQRRSTRGTRCCPKANISATVTKNSGHAIQPEAGQPVSAWINDSTSQHSGMPRMSLIRRAARARRSRPINIALSPIATRTIATTNKTTRLKGMRARSRFTAAAASADRLPAKRTHAASATRNQVGRN